MQESLSFAVRNWFHPVSFVVFVSVVTIVFGLGLRACPSSNSATRCGLTLHPSGLRGVCSYKVHVYDLFDLSCSHVSHEHHENHEPISLTVFMIFER